MQSVKAVHLVPDGNVGHTPAAKHRRSSAAFGSGGKPATNIAPCSDAAELPGICALEDAQPGEALAPARVPLPDHGVAVPEGPAPLQPGGNPLLHRRSDRTQAAMGRSVEEQRGAARAALMALQRRTLASAAAQAPAAAPAATPSAGRMPTAIPGSQPAAAETVADVELVVTRGELDTELAKAQSAAPAATTSAGRMTVVLPGSQPAAAEAVAEVELVETREEQAPSATFAATPSASWMAVALPSRQSAVSETAAESELVETREEQDTELMEALPAAPAATPPAGRMAAAAPGSPPAVARAVAEVELVETREERDTEATDAQAAVPAAAPSAGRVAAALPGSQPAAAEADDEVELVEACEERGAEVMEAMSLRPKWAFKRAMLAAPSTPVAIASVPRPSCKPGFEQEAHPSFSLSSSGSGSTPPTTALSPFASAACLDGPPGEAVVIQDGAPDIPKGAMDAERKATEAPQSILRSGRHFERKQKQQQQMQAQGSRQEQAPGKKRRRVLRAEAAGQGQDPFGISFAERDREEVLIENFSSLGDALWYNSRTCVQCDHCGETVAWPKSCFVVPWSDKPRCSWTEIMCFNCKTNLLLGEIGVWLTVSLAAAYKKGSSAQLCEIAGEPLREKLRSLRSFLHGAPASLLSVLTEGATLQECDLVLQKALTGASGDLRLRVRSSTSAPEPGQGGSSASGPGHGAAPTASFAKRARTHTRQQTPRQASAKRLRLRAQSSTSASELGQGVAPTTSSTRRAGTRTRQQTPQQAPAKRLAKRPAADLAAPVRKVRRISGGRA